MEYDEFRMIAGDHAGEKDSILARADNILQNKILVWGDTFIDFGTEVDFNKDIGRSTRYGFHYWLWARPLNSAYILTGEQRYLQKFHQLFNRWYEQRNRITRSIPDFDPVYYELGLGLRTRVFLEYYRLPHLTRTWVIHQRMLKTLLAAGRWLYELEKWEGYRPGNWQIHGAFMLLQIALTFPEFREAAEWEKVGMYRLEEHLANDFFADGGHSERCPRNYTLATYLAYRNLYYLLQAHRSHDDFAEKILRTMGNTIDWMITMIAPTGETPAINDSHRGTLPVSVLDDGTKLFKRPAGNGILKLLLGAHTREPLTLPTFTSRSMPASGFTVMRSDWTRDAQYMVINHGPAAPTHTHADLMSFEAYAYGQALAVDAGIGMTYDDSLYVPWYQSSRAHNMVVLNDRNMDRKNTTGENVRWMSLKSVEYLAGDQPGYVSQGLHHRRHILYMKSRYWFIIDDLRSTRTGDTLSWYFHSPTTLQRVGRGYTSTTGPGVSVLPAVAFDRREGKGWAAATSVTRPGAVEEINWIRFDQTTEAGTKLQVPGPPSSVPHIHSDGARVRECPRILPDHRRRLTRTAFLSRRIRL